MTTATTNKTNAEVMYGNFTNVSGGTMLAGAAMSYTTTAASVNGNNGVAPATGQLKTFAGILDADVPDTQTGRFIAYGYAASVFIYAIGSSVTIPVDVAMGVANAKTGVNSAGLVDVDGPVVSLEAIGAAINSPGGYAQGFVRAM